MTTDGEKNDRGKDRTEAAFDALSATPPPPPEPDSSNPWKPAALLLLMMALALPLAFGIRSSRVRIEFEGRVAEATTLAAEVQRLADAGDLPAAVLALAEVTEALADVDGLAESTGAVRKMAVQKIADLRAEQNRVAERDARTDRNRRVVDALLAGDPKDASRLISGAKRLGALEKSLERLSLRLDALCMASSVEGEPRAAALELLATAWKLPAVLAEQKRAAEEIRRARESSGHLKAARQARAKGEVASARESLALACSSKGITGVKDEYATLRVIELTETGERLEAAGDHAGAAACFEMAGNRGLADEAHSEAEIETEAGCRKYLIDRLEQRLAAAPDHRTRAVIAGVLAEVTGDKSRQWESDAHARDELLALARTFRAQGELEAALSLAVAAMSAEGADGFRESVSDELARNVAAEHLKTARWVLNWNGPTYAASLVAKHPEFPPEISQKVEAARIEFLLMQARAFIDREDYGGAKLCLVDLPADDKEVQELQRRLILATDDGNFVVELPKDKAEAEALIYRAVLHRFQTDPVAAGKMLATYDKSPAGIVPALAAFLDAADTAEEKAVWQAVKAEVEKRFPKAEEKGPVEPEETVE